MVGMGANIVLEKKKKHQKICMNFPDHSTLVFFLPVLNARSPSKPIHKPNFANKNKESQQQRERTERKGDHFLAITPYPGTSISTKKSHGKKKEASSQLSIATELCFSGCSAPFCSGLAVPCICEIPCMYKYCFVVQARARAERESGAGKVPPRMAGDADGC